MSPAEQVRSLLLRIDSRLTLRFSRNAGGKNNLYFIQIDGEDLAPLWIDCLDHPIINMGRQPCFLDKGAGEWLRERLNNLIIRWPCDQ